MRNSGVDPTDPLGWVLTFAEYGALRPRLWSRNRRSIEPVVATGGANVSLTSYGKRISTVWQTIETIGAGTVKPRRLILWLDDRDAYRDPLATLKRLQARGLEIRRCRDYGPHKKYSPSTRYWRTNRTALLSLRTTMSITRPVGSRNCSPRIGSAK